MNSIGQILGKGAIYRQLLQTDEWKAFSNDIRQNHGGCCCVCKRRGVPTHVHHLLYDPHRMPWEYKPEEVVLLCQDCHEQTHEHLQNFRRFVFGKLTPRAFQILNGALAVGLDHNDPLELTHAIANMCASPWVSETIRARLEQARRTDASANDRAMTPKANLAITKLKE